MSEHEVTVDEMMAEAEEYIQRFARSIGWLPSMDLDDIAQELRIHALLTARKYDPSSGVIWPKYLCMTLKLRKIDIMRLHGTRSRSGRRPGQWLSLEYEDGCDRSIMPEDTSDDFASVDWQDVIDASEAEERRVRAVVLYVSGMTMQDASTAVDRSMAWLSKSLKEMQPHGETLQRVSQLLGVSHADHFPKFDHISYEAA